MFGTTHPKYCERKMRTRHSVGDVKYSLGIFLFGCLIERKYGKYSKEQHSQEPTGWVNTDLWTLINVCVPCAVSLIKKKIAGETYFKRLYQAKIRFLEILRSQIPIAPVPTPTKFLTSYQSIFCLFQIFVFIFIIHLIIYP